MGKSSFEMALMAASVALLASPARAEFTTCRDGLERDAIRAGISEGVAHKAFAAAKEDPKVLELEGYQPEFKTPVWEYMTGLVDDERVRDGKAAMARHAGALAAAERRFGVSRYVLAAIWGVESNFGESMGDRSLVSSLTTLSCESAKRPRYFKSELMAALKIVDRGDVPLDEFTGSWAGAFGQTQFMPSTFLTTAIDLDGTGRDIIHNPAAALGSTANYLKKVGWVTDEPWGYEVALPPDYHGPSGRKDRRDMAFWAGKGIKRTDGERLSGGSASLLLPAGPNGPAFLVTGNFNAIYRYNAAETYALAIGVLAQRLGGGEGIQKGWPTDEPGLTRAEKREMQELLTKRGYDVGAADGAIGAKTRAAIADVQQKAGMKADGAPSHKVLERLRQ